MFATTTPAWLQDICTIPRGNPRLVGSSHPLFSPPSSSPRNPYSALCCYTLAHSGHFL